MIVQESVLHDKGTVCFHCGEAVRHDGVVFDGKPFCCAGCRAVYEILQRNNLCQYYDFDRAPGRSPRPEAQPRFAWLDEPALAGRLKEFSDGTTAAVTLSVPAMHCSSCVWLLEHLHRIDPGILTSRVDFLKKRIAIRFSERATTLRRIVELLVSLGYEPRLSMASGEPSAEEPSSRPLYARIGVAGFCFANIMILSFPEYLSGGGVVDEDLRRVFTLLSLFLSIPVFVYSAGPYFVSAIRGLRRRVVNLDLPIALGIAVLFGRSAAEILFQGGPGYLDSMSGLVFFLLIGRVFQNKTYDSLNFERTYTSYFPLAVTVRDRQGDRAVAVGELKVGDRIVIRHNELVPADAVLQKGEGAIDYSFVTGESLPAPCRAGDLIYAGGRQTGAAIELEVVRGVSQSHLTRLWNESSMQDKRPERLVSLSNTIARWFTPAILVLAAAAAVYWMPRDASRAMNAVIGVLIVACPCALALATPFAYGTAMRIFGRNGLYLKHADVVEAMARTGTVVFDKTGTLTETREQNVRFVGPPLRSDEREAVASVAASSYHPLSRAIAAWTDVRNVQPPEAFSETAGAGCEGRMGGMVVRLGSAEFAGAAEGEREEGRSETRVFVALDGTVRGWFAFGSRFRAGMAELVAALKRHYALHVLSGDTEREKSRLEEITGEGVPVRFRQSPEGKRAYVAALKKNEKSVLMAGDGLNDAGALRTADVGIAVSDDISAFSPACDGIIDGRMLPRLDAMLTLARRSMAFVIGSFAVSLLYNTAVLTVAFQGDLSPILAAILMPLSSITVVMLAAGSVHRSAKRSGLL